MKDIYWLFGRGNESHCLIQTDINNIYKAASPYPIQITGTTDNIVAIDFAGGPILAVEDSFENHTIQSIAYIEKEFYITLK